MGPETVVRLELSDAEAVEFHRFMRDVYLSPNSFPALYKLVQRVDTRVEAIRAGDSR